jgi:ATP-dependent exoDNAse (exonuclease V) alpha subunit
MAMLRNYATMSNADYHKKQIAYNISALTNEIKAMFPDEIEPNLNDPKYAEILKKSPYNPKFMGSLADSLGLSDQVLTFEVLDDIQNGWAPLVDSSKETPSNIEQTPKGPMVKFRATSTPIAEDGSYDQKALTKNPNVGTEFLFTHGERLSTVISLMAIKDPNVMLEFRNCAYEVIEQEVLPAMLNLARMRKGKDGVNYEGAAEILFVPFFHPENRSVCPNLHIHGDLFNVARGYDGEIGSLYTEEIGKNASMLDAIYQAGMKEKLEKKFGFEFETVYHSEDLENDFLQDYERKAVSFDLPAEVVPTSIQDWRSKREREMEAELKTKGMKGYEAKELARHASKDDKTDLTPSEMYALWDSVYKDNNWSVDKFQQDLNQYKATPKALKQVPNDLILEDSFLRNHKDIAFTESQYLAHIHKQLLPYMSSEQAKKEATRIFEKDTQLYIANDQMEFYKPLLENTIEDPIQKASMQLRFLREAKFIHNSTIERDNYISESLKARENETQFKFERKEIEDFIFQYELNNSTPTRAFKFAKQQREAIIMVCSEPGAVSNIAGRAGSGKSTLLKCAREFLVSKGFEVIGTSTSSSATKNLAESTGMSADQFNNTTKLLKLLEEGKTSFTDKTILLWDEAGMADTKTFYEVIKHLNLAGGKMVLCGEQQQLQPIGPGGSFKRLNEQFVTTPVLEINRQHLEWQREMVEDFATGKAHKALKNLYDKGGVSITKSEYAKFDKIANDYLNAKEEFITGSLKITYRDQQGISKEVDVSSLKHYEVSIKDGVEKERTRNFSSQELLDMARNDKKWDKKILREALEQSLGFKVKRIDKVEDNLQRTVKEVDFKDKIIIATTNVDIDSINETVRRKLKDSGVLPKEDILVTCKDNEQRGFCQGDRIIFIKNQKSDDVDKSKLLNAEQGVVTGFNISYEGTPRSIQIRMDDGREISLELNKKNNIKHAYANSVHKSQGQTKTATFFSVSNNMNNLHSAYVACSRHRKNLTLYLSEDMMSKLEDRMEGKGPTEQMKTVAQWVAKEKNLDLPSEILTSFKDTRTFLTEHWYKDGATKPEHMIDRYIDLTNAMSKTAYKKTSDDYKALDENAKSTYASIKASRIQNIRDYKTKKVEVVPTVVKARVAQQQAMKLEATRKQALQESLVKKVETAKFKHPQKTLRLKR